MSFPKLNKQPSDKNRINLLLDDRCREKLERMAKTEGKNISTIVRDLIERGTGYGAIAKKRREISYPRGITKILFKDLSEQQFDDVFELLHSYSRNDLTFRYGRTNYSNVETGLKRWADFNGLSINVDDDKAEPNGKWLVCKHGLGENWAKIHAKSIKKLLEDLGSCGVSHVDTDQHLIRIFYRIPVEEIDDGYYDIKKDDNDTPSYQMDNLKKQIKNESTS